MAWFPRELVKAETTRFERLEILRQYYLTVLFEDPHEGNKFDCDVLDAINALQERYPQEVKVSQRGR